MANSHRKRNCLSKIKVDGVWLTEEQEMRSGEVRGESETETDTFSFFAFVLNLWVKGV